MSDDDLEARKARAARLRKQIDVLTQADEDTEVTDTEKCQDTPKNEKKPPVAQKTRESPREFIHRRTLETARSKKKK